MTPDNEEQKQEDTGADTLNAPSKEEEAVPEPVVTGWVEKEGKFEIYKDPDTEEVTKVRVEGETFARV